MNPFHTLLTYLPKIHFDPNLPSCKQTSFHLRREKIQFPKCCIFSDYKDDEQIPEAQ
jgi:hypothetical protein